ncbi:MAG: hypothetical protein C0399_05170 [Syntrophus sp. (in: bacteria)]|nr:hypothetical protein [Syntrophus sp. (in: bacteria)]
MLEEVEYHLFQRTGKKAENFLPEDGKRGSGKVTRPSSSGRLIYYRRLATVEPVFANIRSTLGLDRFTLRGKEKVNIQWLLYCTVHNLLKVHRYGYGNA